MPKMNQINLTQRMIDTLKPPSQGEKLVMDTKVQGFGVRVRYTGKATYIIRYTAPDGKHKKMTLRDVRDWKLDDARDIAVMRLGEVAGGDDPVAEREAWKKNPVMSELGDETIEHLRSLKKGDKYISDFQRHLDRRINPAIGDMKVRDVSARDVEKIVRGLSDTPRTGNLVRSALSRMFKLARRWNYRLDDPTFGLEKYEEHARERYYTFKELEAVHRALATYDGGIRQGSANAVRLCLFTGARPKEVLGATWDMFDLKTGVWIKPSHHTKQKKVHKAKLASEALEVLHQMHKDAEDEAVYLFPSDGKTGHLTTIKRFWWAVRDAAGLKDAHLYDLRKTFATLLMSRGVDIKTVMKLTGHTQPTTLLKHYAQVVQGAEEKALDGMFG